MVCCKAKCHNNISDSSQVRNVHSGIIIITSISNFCIHSDIIVIKFLVSKETVVLRRWERSKQKFGFIKRVDKGEITTVKDLES